MNQLTSQVLRQVLDSSTEAVLLLSADSPDLPVAYANAQFERLSGYHRERLHGQAWLSLAGADNEAAELREALVAGMGFGGAMHIERDDGTRGLAVVRTHAVNGDDAEIAFWLCQFLPPPGSGNGEQGEAWAGWLEQEGARQRERFGRLDRADGSSGLLRYERFRDFVVRDLGIARRERRPVSIMFLRIVELDRYRATFGKNAADSCLRMIGKQVTATLRRATDLCARFDGDAIVAAVFGQDAAEASRLLDKIAENIDGLRIHNPHGRQHRFLSVRSAVVDSSDGEDQFDALVERLQSAVADGEESAANA